MASAPPRRFFLTGKFQPRHRADDAAIRLRLLPFAPMIAYLVGTFALFTLWPINWPIYGFDSWLSLGFLIAMCFTAIIVGYVVGSRDPGVRLEPVRFIIGVIVAGGILAVLLLVPSSYIYTDRWPWEIGDALRSQGEAYRRFQQTLVEGTGQRGAIALARAVASPFVFAAVPLGIIHWQKVGLFARGCTVAAAVSTLWFSIMRGTDKEFADLLVVMSSAVLILVVRQGRGRSLLTYIRQYWFRITILAVLAFLAINLFNARKSERVGGIENRTVVCANDTRICADLTAPAIRWLPQSQRFGVSFFILSATQGYYGTSLAMQQDFRPTLGVGHSPAALSIYELITGDQQWRTRTYTYRNAFQNWREENFWSSLITSIANDVGFPGAVVVLGIIGFLWGRSWFQAALGGSDPAAIIFCQMMIMMLYLPANNQVYASYDGYAVTLYWGLMWLFQRHARVEMPHTAQVA